MFQLVMIHSNPHVDEPVNNHTWVKEFNTLNDAKQWLDSDLTNNNDVFKSCSLIKID